MIRTGQEGFTLIEGMVAGVVLAVGMLALAAMQSMSLGRNVDASEVTRVTNLAADMMERIQFNRARAAAYNAIDTTAGTPCPNAAVGQPLALGDCTQWRLMLNASGLTGVQGLVVVTATGPTTPPLNQSQVAVTINWLGRVTLGTGTTGGMDVMETGVNVTKTRPRQLILVTIVAPE